MFVVSSSSSSFCSSYSSSFAFVFLLFLISSQRSNSPISASSFLLVFVFNNGLSLQCFHLVLLHHLLRFPIISVFKLLLVLLRLCLQVLLLKLIHLLLLQVLLLAVLFLLQSSNLVVFALSILSTPLLLVILLLRLRCSQASSSSISSYSFSIVLLQALPSRLSPLLPFSSSSQLFSLHIPPIRPPSPTPSSSSPFISILKRPHHAYPRSCPPVFLIFSSKSCYPSSVTSYCFFFFPFVILVLIIRAWR